MRLQYFFKTPLAFKYPLIFPPQSFLHKTLKRALTDKDADAAHKAYKDLQK